jgi:hypothetical protein
MLQEQQQAIQMWSDVRKMNTRSAREYTMFAPAQLLRSWSEQRPSNKNGLDSSVAGGGLESLLDRCEPASEFIFVS